MNYIGKLRKVSEDRKFIVIELDEELETEILQARSVKGIPPVAQIRFDDGRAISAIQRRKIYAIIKDVTKVNGGEYYRWEQEETKEQLKQMFMAATGIKHFSLSDVDMTTAKDFISWLIEFCIEQGIELHKEGYKLSEDISRYVYFCLNKRICCITGESKGVHIHHIDVVGMGNNRKKVNNLNLEIIPLRWDKHQEFHTRGDKVMLDYYHVQPIKADVATLKRLKLNYEDID